MWSIVERPPLWPQANGEVEHQNRTLLKALKIAQVEGKNWKAEMNKFLMAYRSTPHTTTGTSPYALMFGREMCTKLPDLRRKAQIADEEAREKDWEKKVQGKQYADKKRRAKDSGIEPGDQVLLKVDKTNKLSSNFRPDPLVVVKKEDGEVTLKSDQGVEIKRNASFIRKYHMASDKGTTGEKSEDVGERTEDGTEDTRKDGDTLPGENRVVMTPSIRPQRMTKVPERYKDYVMT